MSRQLILIFATAAALSACGGSGGDDVAVPVPGPPAATPAPPPAVMVPDAVSGSVATFIGYLVSLTGLMDQTAEPLDVSSVNPPTTETAEPTPLP